MNKLLTKLKDLEEDRRQSQTSGNFFSNNGDCNENKRKYEFISFKPIKEG